jgi:porin
MFGLDGMHITISRFGIAALVASTAFSDAAFAQESATPSVELAGRYVVDTVYVAKGAEADRAFVLHDAELSAHFDFDRWIGVSGLTGGVHLLATAGGAPNDAAGTLQGINNIEVSAHRAKLYEAWLEQTLGGASLRIGLTDLNADFYQSDSAGLLIEPAFGIGSELAATGPNGPSIFPSTALTARLAVKIGETGYARAAVVDAKSGVLGDPNGVDFSLRDGALVIAEAGTTAFGKLAIGAWRYTRRQDDVHAITLAGDPVKRIAAGAYLLADHQIAGGEGHAVNLFLRAGISEGQTTPFRGGFQTGVLVEAPIAGRPDGQLSFGVQHGLLSRGYRDLFADAGARAAPAEWGVELTYADRLASFLTVQPDLQYIRRAFGEGKGRATVVLGLRLIAEFSTVSAD